MDVIIWYSDYKELALDRLQDVVNKIHATGKPDIYSELYMASINLLAEFGRSFIWLRLTF